MQNSTKRLYRSTTDRQIAGVCAGIAEYLNIDPTLVRIIFVILALSAGPGILLYIILWAIMPEPDPFMGDKPKNDFDIL
jgi:phage shock protein PspC (stress-responsive transcriptional regulator)